MGKHGGRQTPAGEEKGWGEGGTEGPGWPSLPCTAKCPEQSSKGPHTWANGPAHVRWDSPLAPRGRPAWPEGSHIYHCPQRPPCPLCGHPGSGTAEPSHPIGTGPPKHHLAVSEVASQARKRARPQRTAGAANLSHKFPAQSGPWKLDIWEEPPRRTTGVCRWEVGPQSELLSLLLCSQPGALAFLPG